MKRSTKERLKDSATVVGGSVLGSAAGYGAVQALKRTQSGKSFRTLHPDTRLNFIVPAMTGLGAGTYALQYAKNRQRQKLEKGREKRAFVLDWVYDHLVR